MDGKRIKIIENKYFILKNKNELENIFFNFCREGYNEILFINCYFDTNVILEDVVQFYFLECTIKNLKIKFKEIEKSENNNKIYLLNSSINKVSIDNFHNSIFIYNDKEYLKYEVFGIKIYNCLNINIAILNFNNNIVNLILEKTKHASLYINSRRKLCTMLDDESSSLKQFYYNIEFENKTEIKSFREVTYQYYRYQKINYDENRFLYYEILNYLEYLLCNKYSKITKLLFKELTGYFISPIRIIIICMIIIIISSILYLFTGIKIDGQDNIIYNFNNIVNIKISDILKSIYLSITTFSTVGYGNVTPLGYGEGVACFEMLFGAIYISIFTGSIFKRYLD